MAAPGAPGDAVNAPKACLPNSSPADDRARCVCAPGFYALLGGQTPRCEKCGGASYNDEPNTRMACKLCPFGKVSNPERTGCGEDPGAAGTGACEGQVCTARCVSFGTAQVVQRCGARN